MPSPRLRAALVAAAALALMAIPAAPAVAATPTSTGWVRVAHLSPDTKPVDVRIVSLTTGDPVLRIDDVAYGAVSKYSALPAGGYAVAMRPAGAAASSTPVVQTSMEVQAHDASTVAVFGKNAALRTRVVHDALTLPKAGDARVRVIQASTGSQPVTVTADRTAIVADATGATVSPYKDVRAGSWALTATRTTGRATATVDLRAGQIATVFVLDDADGGLVLRRVLDSASVGGVPTGYLATGGGFLAHQADRQRDDVLAVVAGAAVVAMLLAAATLRRRRAHARA